MSTKKFQIHNPNPTSSGRFVIHQDKEVSEHSAALFLLEPVLRKVDNAHPTLASGAVQKVIKFDRRKGKVVTGFDISWLRDRQEDYYLVTSGRSMETPRMGFQVNYRTYGYVWLHAEFTIRCLPGLEEKLVETLARDLNPAFVLDQLITKWVSEVVEASQLDMIKNLTGFKGVFRQEMSQRAATIGLEMEVRFFLKNEDKRESMDIDSRGFFNVQPRSYSDFVRLSFSARLQVDDRQGGSASLFHDQQEKLRELLIDGIKNITRLDFTYNQLFNDLNGSVRDRLIEMLNEWLRLKNTGREIAEIRFETDEVFEPFMLEKFHIVCPLRDGVEITLVNTVTLNLENPEVYKTKRITDLREWTSRMLTRIAIRELVGASFADMVAELHTYEASIKREFEVEAQQIGYDVQYFLTSREVDTGTVDRIEFELDEDQWEFPTSIDGVNVKLNVIVNGRIRDFQYEKLRKHLRPDVDLTSVIRKEVYRKTRHFLHSTDPNDFYTKFEGSIADELTNRILSKLVEEFNLERETDIILKRLETDLIERLRKLQTGFHTCIVESNDNRLIFESKFSVLRIYPETMQRFKSLNYSSIESEIGAISNILKAHLNPELNLYSIHIADLDDPRLLNKVFELLEDSAVIVRDEFGLEIQISKGLWRLPNEDEKYKQKRKKVVGKANEDLLNEQMKVRLLQYKSQAKQLDEINGQIELATSSDDHERLKKLKKEKKRIEEIVYKADSFGTLTEKPTKQLKQAKNEMTEKLLGSGWDTST